MVILVGNGGGLIHSAPAGRQCCYCAPEDEGIFRCFPAQAMAVFPDWTLNTAEPDWPLRRLRLPFFPFIAAIFPPSPFPFSVYNSTPTKPLFW